MEKNIIITDTSHNKIYQTYFELKKKLPPNFLKIKVFSSPKYALNKKTLLKMIENDKIKIKNEKPSSIDKFINGKRNIYILSDKTIKFKNAKRQKMSDEQKYEEMLKKTLLTEKDKNIINNNNNEKNKINLDLNERQDDTFYQRYSFHPNIITDVQMKNNIYLPKIIDRMKYNVPRNERDKNGFHIEGIGIFNNNGNKKIKYDEKNDNYEINLNPNNLENDGNANENNY